MTEKDIVVEKIQALKFWDHVYQEVLRLVLEKENALNNFTMSGLDHVTSQGGWKIHEETIPILIKVVKFGSLSEVIFDFALGFYWQIESFGVVSHCVQLLSQLSLFIVLVLNQRCNVSNSERIEIDSHDHPNESPNVFKVMSESKISVANSCDSLECPVEGLSVLVK